jgi:uncharacterized RDD family membrane protein YckC
MQDNNPYAAPNAVVGDAQSTEQVLAGRGMRLVASIIDTLILMVLVIPVMLVGGLFAMVMSGEEPGFGTTVMIAVASFVLFVIVQGYPLSATGQTWGKKALGMKIVDLAGNKPEFGKLIGLRYLTTWVIGAVPVLGTIYQFVNVLFIFGDDRRCIHDKIAGTRVVMV